MASSTGLLSPSGMASLILQRAAKRFKCDGLYTTDDTTTRDPSLSKALSDPHLTPGAQLEASATISDCTRTLPDRPECTRTLPDRPECTRTLPDRPDCTRTLPDRPDCTRTLLDRPDCTRTLPDRPDCTRTLPDRLLDLELQQTMAIRALSFQPPVTTVYHPLDYANEPHSDFVHRYCTASKDVVFIGMNPGPFGMVQSGVPFGDCRIVREWLRISGRVWKPSNENAKRPIIGLECARSEISGTRFWTFIRSLCKDDDPQSFFRHCYVHNYCPAAFIDHKGKNITPATLKKSDLRPLELICDEYLLKSIDLLQARTVVGIGAYAYERCKRVLEKKLDIRVEGIMHPSPANPATNTGGGWPVKVKAQLQELDLLRYMVT